MTAPELQTDNWVPELTFAARLALVRHKMGWNIKEAAVACGLPAQSWRGWEINGREPHRLITIAMVIATRTGVDLDWLVYGPNKPAKPIPTGMRPEPRVVATVVAREPASDPLRPVRQTRPSMSNKPFNRSVA